MKPALLLTIVLMTVAQLAYPADYRSRQSGNWNVATTWEIFNGSIWINASTFPTDADGIITIRASHTVTVTATVDVNQLVIAATGLLIHNNGTLRITDGTGTDMTINGNMELNSTFTLDNNSTLSLFGRIDKYSGGFNINTGAKLNIENGGYFRKVGGGMDVNTNLWVVKNGGTYEHADDGTGLPQADWQTNSTCLVTGTTTNKPGNLDQIFYHFTWNCPGQTQQENFNNNFITVLGNLTIISTGSGRLELTQNGAVTTTVSGNYIQQGGVFAIAENGDYTMTVGGNFTVTGGSFLMTDNFSGNASGNVTLNVTGNMSITSATFNANQYTGTTVTRGISTINLAGNFTVGTGATFTETAATTGKGIINFNGSATQNFIKSGTISNTIDYNILSGATLNMSTYTATGTGTFTVNADGGIMMGSAQGITASGASGNVQVTGTRSYSTSGYYTYNGGIAQATGNGLPSTVKRLTIDNTSNVTATASITVTNILTLTNGSLVTGAGMVTLGTSTAVPGTLSRTNGFINGTFRRWIPVAAASYVFPLESGGTSKLLTHTYTGAPSAGGTITAQFIASNPGSNGFPMFPNGYPVFNTNSAGYWTLVPANGLTGGTFSLDMTLGGFSGITNVASLLITSRTSAPAAWTLSGTNAFGTLVGGIPTAHRTGLNFTNQHFAITDGEGISLALGITAFKASLDNNAVLLSWNAEPGSNDIFTIERSSDGTGFSTLGVVYATGGAKNFTYKDNSPLAGTNYYRVVQTEPSGKSVTSPIGIITYKTDVAGLQLRQVWPMPFIDQINVKVYAPVAGTITADIYNIAGMKIYSAVVAGTSGINTLNLTPRPVRSGMYVLVVRTGNQVTSQKMISK